MTRFAARRWEGVAFAVAAAALQFVPLCDVLGYEYAMACGALVVVLGTTSVVRAPVGAVVWVDFARHALRLSTWIGAATAISLVNALRVRNCDVPGGLAFMALFGGGAIPMAVAAAMVAARMPTRRSRMLCAVGVPAFSLASTLWTLATQPAIVAYDTLWGYYAGSIYDESLTALMPHVTYRAWSLTWAVGLVSLVGWVAGERGRHGRRVLLALGVALALWLSRGALGLERDRAYVERALAGVARTEHFTVFYDADAFRGRRLDLLLYDHEARYAQLADFWRVEPSGPLRSYVYGSADRKGALMGGRRTLVAKLWLGEIHVVWSDTGDEMLAHEMGHLFLRDDGFGPLDLASRNGLIPLMALVEGAAAAASGESRGLDHHAWSAAMYRAGVGREIPELLGPRGFWGNYARLSYTLVGSFARWLIDTRGPEAFRAAYRHGDFEGAYGEPLESLARAWRAWLDDIALTPEQLDAARFRFDRPSLFGKTCARAIATRMDEGDAFLSAGRGDEAARCFESIVRDDPRDVTIRLRIAERYADLGRTSDATRHAEAIVEAEGAGADVQRRAAELLADLMWRAEAYDRALARYRALEPRAGTEADRRRLQAKIAALASRAAYPQTAHAVRRYLVDRPAPPAVSTAVELAWAAATEGAPIARYLAALRAAGDDPAAPIPALLDPATRAALSLDQQRRALQARAEYHTARGETDVACEAWAEAEAAAAPWSELAATAASWAQRCRLGRMPPAAGP